jgi:glycosyltransferase involved in cell wall biosynthesis
MKEVVTRPRIYKIWKRVEKFAVPSFPRGYTVDEQIAREFSDMYGSRYEVIRNVPVLEELSGENTDRPENCPKGKFILYQGSVNEGRCFEWLIPAMQQVDAPLVICGRGNYLVQARGLVKKHQLEEKVIFMGSILPGQLKKITRAAWCGITLFDRTGASNYYSLANRFFDYIHAGIPQLAMNYPAYREINNLCPIAVLIDEPGIQAIADALNTLLHNNELHHTLQENCEKARLQFNWHAEEEKLLRFYNQIFN